MSDFPFHVVGGRFELTRKPLNPFDAPLASDSSGSDRPLSGSRRRKLWEVAHKCHCPIVGTCFEVGELRALMRKVLHLPHDTTDFVLHTTAVGACENRSQLAELLQKQLEKRFQATIRRFASAKRSDTLLALWQEACRDGTDIPGALWATWSHPACDKLLEQTVYGDIHMIQHQVGTGTRADLKTLNALRSERSSLREEIARLRDENEALRSERAQENLVLTQRITELRADVVGRDAKIAELTSQLSRLRDSLPDLSDRQTLIRRASDAEARCAALSAHAAAREKETERLRALLQHAETMIEQYARTCQESTDDAEPDSAPPMTQLCGKSVLCVGGRSGAIDAYRQLVERMGGRFLHHDGGLEESLHRIDGALAAADLVICQAGCISHNAYWRVKEQCKRTGKTCLFLRGAGVTSFGRVVSQACTVDHEITTNMNLVDNNSQ